MIAGQIGLYPLVDQSGVIMFVTGLTLLFCAIGFAMFDLKRSLDPVVLETKFVTRRLRGMDRA